MACHDKQRIRQIIFGKVCDLRPDIRIIVKGMDKNVIRILRQSKGRCVLRQADIPDIFFDDPDLPFAADRERHTEADLLYAKDLLQGSTVLLHFSPEPGRTQGIQSGMGQGMAGDLMAPVLLHRIRKVLAYHRMSFKFPDEVLQAGIFAPLKRGFSSAILCCFLKWAQYAPSLSNYNTAEHF